MEQHQSETFGVLWVRRHVYYGRETFFPECPRARKIAELLKQKTLTADDITVLKEIGYEIRLKGETL